MNEDIELWFAMKPIKYRRTIELLRESLKSFHGIVDQAIAVSLNTVCSAMHVQAGTFWFYDQNGDEYIRPKAQYGGKDTIIDISLKKGEGVAGQVVMTGEPTIINDCQNDDRWSNKADSKTGFITNSMICVPIAYEDSIFGCIQLINKIDNSSFDNDDLTFAQNLAKVISEEFNRLNILSNKKTDFDGIAINVEIKGIRNVMESYSITDASSVLNSYYQVICDILTDNSAICCNYTRHGVIGYWLGNNEKTAQKVLRTAKELTEHLKTVANKFNEKYDVDIYFTAAIDYGTIVYDEVGNDILKRKILSGIPVENIIAVNNLVQQKDIVYFVQDMEKVLPFNTKFKKIDLSTKTDLESIKTVLTL